MTRVYPNPNLTFPLTVKAEGHRRPEVALEPSLYVPMDARGLVDLSPNGYTVTNAGGVTADNRWGVNWTKAIGSADFAGASAYLTTNYKTRRNWFLYPGAEDAGLNLNNDYGTCVPSTDYARTGSRSFKAQTDGAGGVDTYHGASLGTAHQFETWTLSAYIRGTVAGGGVTAFIQPLNAGAVITTYAGTYLPVTTTGWQRVSVTATMPASTNGIRGGTIGYQGGSGYVYTDDMLLELESAVYPYFDGSGYYNDAGTWVDDPRGHVGWHGTAHQTQSDLGAFANGTGRTYCGWAYSDEFPPVARTLMGSGNGGRTYEDSAIMGVGTAWNGWHIWPSYDDDGSGDELLSAGYLSHQWFHWAITVDNLSARLYLNGSPVGSAATVTYWGLPMPPGPLSIGAWGGANNPWDGAAAHYAVYERTLTDDEIAYLAAG